MEARGIIRALAETIRKIAAAFRLLQRFTPSTCYIVNCLVKNLPTVFLILKKFNLSRVNVVVSTWACPLVLYRLVWTNISELFKETIRRSETG